ncbi:hypothetical protein BDY19DRAFT_976328 [Irpex rosettiformis]|uniref:Uncharacterized protein n=1 Tax=Irpex rosettiformis TaxID=378272 RepID=A0ACB8TNZ4_9APHY|nr:hypothetical protein BDY19DRAFT_976328 [Irpex rosettiformis]
MLHVLLCKVSVATQSNFAWMPKRLLTTNFSKMRIDHDAQDSIASKFPVAGYFRLQIACGFMDGEQDDRTVLTVELSLRRARVVLNNIFGGWLSKVGSGSALSQRPHRSIDMLAFFSPAMSFMVTDICQLWLSLAFERVRQFYRVGKSMVH